MKGTVVPRLWRHLSDTFSLDMVDEKCFSLRVKRVSLEEAKEFSKEIRRSFVSRGEAAIAMEKDLGIEVPVGGEAEKLLPLDELLIGDCSGCPAGGPVKWVRILVC